jgi:hypothetical protein
VLAAGLMAVLALAGAGCGDKFENEPRIPDTLQLNAKIGDEQLLISPDKFGAGVVFISISNQTKSTASLQFRGPTEFTSDPVPAGGTTNVKVNLLSGDYEVTATGSDAFDRPVFLAVGPTRPSAQNTVLLP